MNAGILISGAVGLALVGIPYLAWDHLPRWYQRHRTRAWPDLARARGLYLHPDGLRMSGRSGDHFVWAQADPLGTSVWAQLWPPLDLGLTRRYLEWTPGWLAERIRRADEPNRARELASFELRVALEQARRSAIGFDDEAVSARVAGAAPADQLAVLLDQVLDIAKRIDQGRSGVSPAAAVSAVEEDWKRFSAARLLSVQTAPFGFMGRDAGHSLRVFAKRIDPTQRSTVAMLEFATPLGIGFLARVHGYGKGMPWSTRVVGSGDEDFDRIYEVIAREEEPARVVLDARARKRLSELALEGQRVLLDDYGVLIEKTGLADTATLERMLGDARSVAELIDLAHPKRAGAYR